MILNIKRSVLVLAVRLCLLLFLIDTVYALIIVAFLRFAPAAQFDYYFILLLWALHTVKFVILSILMLRVLLKWLGQSYVVHDYKLIINTGIVASIDKVYELDKVEKITVHQDWLGRLMHYGIISIKVEGSDEPIELTDVSRPREYEKSLVQTFM